MSVAARAITHIEMELPEVRRQTVDDQSGSATPGSARWRLVHHFDAFQVAGSFHGISGPLAMDRHLQRSAWDEVIFHVTSILTAPPKDSPGQRPRKRPYHFCKNDAGPI
jgi:hypothetical protein